MTSILYKISLKNCGETDKCVIGQAITTHIPRVEIVDDQSDLELSQDMIATTPHRIGKILDYIEREIFNNQYPKELTYQNYHLTWKTSELMITEQVHKLSDREKTLTAELLLAKDNGCTRAYLLEKIWGYRIDLETHALETQIYRLRQKIEPEPDNPQHLVTADGGYRLQ
jgi:DNA-binding response OmpR family regulator